MFSSGQQGELVFNNNRSSVVLSTMSENSYRVGQKSLNLLQSIC